MTAYGVYGLRLTGLEIEAGDRPAPPSEWPEWRVVQDVDPTSDDSAGMTVTMNDARIGVPGLGEILVSRQAATVRFRTQVPLQPEALLHPALVPAAAIISWWADRVPVHASAVVVGGKAWGLLADREGGKSTAAALLAEQGCELLTDDMLIVDGERCFAGPGNVDLRSEAAAELGGTVALGVVGQRERFRRPFATTLLEAPLAGWVELGWSQDGSVHLEDMPPGERIATLSRHATLPMEGEQLLSLAAVPMRRFLRPRSLTSMVADAGELRRQLAEG